MRRAGLVALLAALACGILAAPAAAAARPSLPHDVADVARRLAGVPAAGGDGSRFEATVDLRARGGYEVEVFGSGHSVGIVIGRSGARDLSSASYVVRGTVTRGRIKARWGSLGSISMRFRPAADPRPSGSSLCFGGFALMHTGGVYTGRLRFRGEGGYVSLDVRRAKGGMIDVKRGCDRRGASAAARASSTKAVAEPESSYLSASWKHGVSSLDFLAIDDGRKGASFLVKSEASRGRMAISRSLLLASPNGVVKADDALTSGRVQAPKPFRGAATYAASADGIQTWNGKLAVDLLGEPHVPLTGPRFDEVELGRASRLGLLFLLLESL